MLNRRYAELKNGKVTAVDGEKIFAQLRKKSELRRTKRT
jgi:hypothetical protein